MKIVCWCLWMIILLVLNNRNSPFIKKILENDKWRKTIEYFFMLCICLYSISRIVSHRHFLVNNYEFALAFMGVALLVGRMGILVEIDEVSKSYQIMMTFICLGIFFVLLYIGMSVACWL